MPALAPFDNMQQMVAKTPNTGLSSKKIKALQAGKQNTTLEKTVPQTRLPGDDYDCTSVNEQI